MLKTAYQLSGGSPIFKGSPHTFPNESVLLTAQKRKGQYKPQTEAKRLKLV